MTVDTSMGRADGGSRRAGTPPAPVLDPVAVAGLYEHLDAAVVAEILTTAVADMRKYGAAVLAASPADPEKVKRPAHALAGVSASVGAVELAALARRVEEEASAVGVHREALGAALGRASEQLTAVIARHGGAALPAT